MRRIFIFIVVLFAFCLIANRPVFSQEPLCSTQVLDGTEPAVKSEKLGQKIQRLCFSQLVLLYSAVARAPLWSAEHLTADRIEQARRLPRLRSNAFHEEERLPADLRAVLADYRGSGFDRGHMSPNGDMSTPEAQAESFSLANMVPQHPCNNEVLWEGIESAVRDMAVANGDAYVVTGPAFLGSSLQSLKGHVLVPTHIYKAVYVPSQHKAGAYFAPNDASQEWEAISIAELEARIGIDVFPTLKAEVRKQAMALPEPTPHFGCRVRTTEAASPSDKIGR